MNEIIKSIYKFKSDEEVNIFLENEKILDEIHLSTDLNEIYKLFDKVLDNVKLLYPKISCKSGCNICCKVKGSPITYHLEWEQIKSFLDSADESYKEKIKNALDLVKENLKKSKGSMSTKDLINFVECPFLQNEVCSIYSIRPMTCRLYGNTISKLEISKNLNDHVYTCEVESQRWKMDLKQRGTTKAGIPIGVSLEDKIKDLSQEQYKEKPLLLLSFIDNYFYKSIAKD